MKAAVHFAYRATSSVVAGAASIAIHVPSGAKWMRSLRGRQNLLRRYAAWGATGRDRARPLLWMHAPSVGEGLQARPVLERLRAHAPSLQIAYTHYSPSAEGLASALRESGLVDFADYLPWDTVHDVRPALDVLAPSVLVFSKLDVWPTLVAEAAARGVRLGLISATLRAGSARQSWLGRSLLRDAYAKLDAVGAIHPADAERLRRLGVRPESLHVTGDTRYDQVWGRANTVDRTVGPLAMLAASPRPTLVAGSTWPADEQVILEGWRLLHDRFPTLRLVLVPHEPTPTHLASIERWARERCVRWVRLSDQMQAHMDAGAASPSTSAVEATDMVVVDRVGLLGALYALADVAFVGGAFHRAGIHSVLEPAAFGIPVLFGPQHGSSADAQRLLDGGGAVVVGRASDVDDVAGPWLADASFRRQAGNRAREVVRGGLGATDRSLEMLRVLLDES